MDFDAYIKRIKRAKNDEELREILEEVYEDGMDLGYINTYNY
jgi:hypothetical protein